MIRRLCNYAQYLSTCPQDQEHTKTMGTHALTILMIDEKQQAEQIIDTMWATRGVMRTPSGSSFSASGAGDSSMEIWGDIPSGVVESASVCTVCIFGVDEQWGASTMDHCRETGLLIRAWTTQQRRLTAGFHWHKNIPDIPIDLQSYQSTRLINSTLPQLM